jgi:hypothetical protein
MYYIFAVVVKSYFLGLKREISGAYRLSTGMLCNVNTLLRMPHTFLFSADIVFRVLAIDLSAKCPK